MGFLDRVEHLERRVDAIEAVLAEAYTSAARVAEVAAELQQAAGRADRARSKLVIATTHLEEVLRRLVA